MARVVRSVATLKRPLPCFGRSQVAQHNDEAHGHWLIIDGSVYDVSELMLTHPGGAHVLQRYAGRDATEAFRGQHDDGSAIALPLAQARIGALQELECLIRPEHTAHCAACRLLVDALALVVETQNALTVDHASELTAPRGLTVSAPLPRSRHELQRGLTTHARFHRESLDVLLGTTLSSLASEIRATDTERRRQLQLERLRGAWSHADARTDVQTLLDRFDKLTDDELTMTVASFEVLDSWLLSAWKRELLRAVRALERTHAATLPLHDIPSVHDVCDRLLAHLGEYFRHADALTHGASRGTPFVP